MEIEAALAPPRVRLQRNLMQFAFRLTKLSKYHPLNIQTSNELVLPKPTRLDRIKHSIKNLINLHETETVKQFQFKPWGQDPPYIVTIERIQKDEAAERHQSLLQ